MRDQHVMRIDAGAIRDRDGAGERCFVDAAAQKKSVFRGMRGALIFATPRGVR